MLTNKEIDAKIARIMEVKVNMVAGHVTDVDGSLLNYEFELEYSPSTNLQQAMELAEKYRLDIDFEIMSICKNTEQCEFLYRLINFKNLTELPRDICEVVLLIEGVSCDNKT